MKNKIQKEKAEFKIESICRIIEGLIEYNAIENYDNVKSFNIKMNYIYDQDNRCYKYTFGIYRGYNNELISEFHISYRKKINDILEKMILRLSSNHKLSYAAFSSEERAVDKYNMVFENGITVAYSIYDDEDKKFYKNLNKEVRETVGDIRVIGKTTGKSDKSTKDKTQAIKALKIVRIAEQIFENMINYNNIDGYINQKPFKVVIDNTYEENRDLNRYSIKVIRGSINPTILFEMRFQIQNNSVLYEDFYDTIMKYLNDKKLLYYPFSTIGTQKELFGIKLRNNTEINFLYNSEKDKKFFNELKNDNKEVGEKRILEKKPEKSKE